MGNREEQIQELVRINGFDEIVVGCFLSNYKRSHVCPIATGGWCRDYTKCKCMEEGINSRIKEQQAHNETVIEDDIKLISKTTCILGIAFILMLIDVALIYYLVGLVFGFI